MEEKLDKEELETQASKLADSSQIGKMRGDILRKRNPELTEKMHQIVTKVIKMRRQDSTSQESNLDMGI